MTESVIEHALCIDCAADRFLKKEINRLGSEGYCTVCDNNSSKVLKTDDEHFRAIITCLIRYYFSEWDYHRKLGGNDIDSLLNIMLRGPGRKQGSY